MSETGEKKPGISARRRFADYFWLSGGIAAVLAVVVWLGLSAADFYGPSGGGQSSGSQSSSGGLLSAFTESSEVARFSAALENYNDQTGSYPSSSPTKSMIARALGGDEEAHQFTSGISISGLPSSQPGDLIYLPVRDGQGSVTGYLVAKIVSPGQGRSFAGEEGSFRLAFGGEPATGEIGEINFNLPGGKTPVGVIMQYGQGENVQMRRVSE